eukprot:365467-Chlamydomonas_euryale.AAC.6
MEGGGARVRRDVSGARGQPVSDNTARRCLPRTRQELALINALMSGRFESTVRGGHTNTNSQARACITWGAPPCSHRRVHARGWSNCA